MVGDGAGNPQPAGNITANESMENIFEQNLRQLSEVEMQEKSIGKHKIDLLTNDEEDSELA